MFTAAMARALPADLKFKKELAEAEARLERFANTTNQRHIDRNREVGVLISATDVPRMEAAMAERGFRTTLMPPPEGYLRVYW